MSIEQTVFSLKMSSAEIQTAQAEANKRKEPLAY